MVPSQSKPSNQHQDHDAILEEINKALKSLIPSSPSQQHWEIAARNCENETHRTRTRPNFIAESRRFRVQIRKTQFANLNACDHVFQYIIISCEWILGEEFKLHR